MIVEQKKGFRKVINWIFEHPQLFFAISILDIQEEIVRQRRVDVILDQKKESASELKSSPGS